MTSDASNPDFSNTSKPASAQKLRLWVIAVCGITVLITLIPYLIGYSLSAGRQYMWLGYNLDDSCVYLSWMRQAANGALRSYDLFTTNPQHGMALNPLFLLLGNVSRITNLPLIFVYHSARLIFGFCLLLLVWKFISVTVSSSTARRISLMCVCFSAGLGWLPFFWDIGGLSAPIDAWQPEAITFLSLYLSPLFCFSMALQVAVLLLLFKGNQTGRMKYAVYSGVCGFILGLVHTYDVISLSAVWLVFLIFNTIQPINNSEKKTLFTSWLQALVAGGITLPAVAYIALQLQTESVFRQRANVQTLSANPGFVILGYGLTLGLAILTIYLFATRRRSSNALSMESSLTETASATASNNFCWWTNPASPRLLINWAISNFLASYLPTAFQRKLLQGEHFPIAILAGIGATWLFYHSSLHFTPSIRRITIVLLILILSLTNVRFMMRDIVNDEVNLVQTKQQRAYLKQGEIEALQWFTANVPPDKAVQPMPYLGIDRSDPDHTKFGSVDMTVACFTPGLTGHAVYCGHWGETPDYGAKLNELTHFALPRTTDTERIALLKKMRVDYLIFSQKEQNDEAANTLMPMFRGLIVLPPYLKLVHSNSDADIYQIDQTALR